MDIGLGTYKGEKNQVSKTWEITNKIENVILKEDTNVVQPTFVFSFPQGTDISDFNKYNYLQWYKMGRYYFIDDMRIGGAGRLLEVVCKEDFLVSWRNSIKGSTQYVDRQENRFSRKIVDEKQAYYTNTKTSYFMSDKKISNVKETEYNYVLITSGKKKEGN